MVSPIAEDALAILAISKQEFPTAICLIAANNAARDIHLSKLGTLIASPDLSTVACLVEQSAKASFTFSLSRPDVHVSSV